MVVEKDIEIDREKLIDNVVHSSNLLKDRYYKLYYTNNFVLFNYIVFIHITFYGYILY